MNEERTRLLFFAKNMTWDTAVPVRGVASEAQDMLAWQQLRCLWTAYILHKGYEPDTAQYDGNFDELYATLTDAFGVEDIPAPNGFTKDYAENEDIDIKDEFDLWLGEFLA